MNWILKVLTALIFFSPCINSQQNYSGNEVLYCHETTTSESFLYTCNGHFSSCKAFLIFTAKPPYNTVPAIAALTSSDQSELAKINNVTNFTVFPTHQEVIIPINCSCSDGYYSSSTTYNIPTEHETYFTIANNTFQGLSTCSALKQANSYDSRSHKLRVPLRCACPTRQQTVTETKYLLTYSIGLGDMLYALSKRFNTSLTKINEANHFSDEPQTIYPFTTILIPLVNEPTSSYTVTRGYEMPEWPLPVPTVRRSRSNTFLSAAGIAAGALSLIIFLILVLIFLFHKKRRTLVVPRSRGRNAKEVASPEELILEIAKFRRALTVFKFSEIKKATGNFQSRNRIKGCVYRGNFRKDVFTIKKGKIGNSDNEVKTLHQINHFNIVKLHGFSEYKENLYLVYEYMKNGSLREWLGKSVCRDWNHRICIALDVANGLLYLHSFTSPAYVHNDIRSGNILLDGNLRAKIANFSLARKANSDAIIRVRGRHGYVGPEYLDPGPITPEVDVFAFGVVLLELITGKCPVIVQAGAERLLWMTVGEVMESENAETEIVQFIEPCLGQNGGIEYAIQVVKLSLKCLARDPGDRPNMVEVVSILLKLQSYIHKVVN
ncbi:hypothetical protein BUALT_Bualt08G0062000 [Buddleja alternifolia]|uniref:Uncharacterized protein n=1 Tax=Buddleja alternifolia TaxID=168488 RepID=A0AAV6XC72_9LAMI|nr:hypothetical protein BUALT_Bualt08G0062000 [Buddleja alternifolia]